MSSTLRSTSLTVLDRAILRDARRLHEEGDRDATAYERERPLVREWTQRLARATAQVRGTLWGGACVDRRTHQCGASAGTGGNRCRWRAGWGCTHDETQWAEAFQELLEATAGDGGGLRQVPAPRPYGAYIRDLSAALNSRKVRRAYHGHGVPATVHFPEGAVHTASGEPDAVAAAVWHAWRSLDPPPLSLPADQQALLFGQLYALYKTADQMETSLAWESLRNLPERFFLLSAAAWQEKVPFGKLLRDLAHSARTRVVPRPVTPSAPRPPSPPPSSGGDSSSGGGASGASGGRRLGKAALFAAGVLAAAGLPGAYAFSFWGGGGGGGSSGRPADTEVNLLQACSRVRIDPVPRKDLQEFCTTVAANFPCRDPVTCRRSLDAVRTSGAVFDAYWNATSGIARRLNLRPGIQRQVDDLVVEHGVLAIKWPLRWAAARLAAHAKQSGLHLTPEEEGLLLPEERPSAAVAFSFPAVLRALNTPPVVAGLTTSPEARQVASVAEMLTDTLFRQGVNAYKEKLALSRWGRDAPHREIMRERDVQIFFEAAYTMDFISHALPALINMTPPPPSPPQPSADAKGNASEDARVTAAMRRTIELQPLRLQAGESDFLRRLIVQAHEEVPSLPGHAVWMQEYVNDVYTGLHKTLDNHLIQEQLINLVHYAEEAWRSRVRSTEGLLDRALRGLQDMSSALYAAAGVGALYLLFGVFDGVGLIRRAFDLLSGGSAGGGGGGGGAGRGGTGGAAAPAPAPAPAPAATRAPGPAPAPAPHTPPSPPVPSSGAGGLRRSTRLSMGGSAEAKRGASGPEPTAVLFDGDQKCQSGDYGECTGRQCPVCQHIRRWGADRIKRALKNTSQHTLQAIIRCYVIPPNGRGRVKTVDLVTILLEHAQAYYHIPPQDE